MIKFQDFYPFRVQDGEGQHQASFLKRCQSLKRLKLTVSEPTMFGWATGPDSGQVTTCGHGHDRYLNHLEELTVRLDTTLAPVNKAIEAFGGSLKRILINGYHSPIGVLAKDARDFPTRHSRIGDWDLPGIKSIKIALDDIPNLYVGDFGRCQTLTKLLVRVTPLHPITRAAVVAIANNMQNAGSYHWPCPCSRRPRPCFSSFSGMATSLSLYSGSGGQACYLV